MSEDKSKPNSIIVDFLEGLIALDEEEKKPENIDPYFRNMEGAGGIHFWQLQQCIVELAFELVDYESQFDALDAEWRNHEQFWGRYLGTAAIQFARNLIDDPEYMDEEFSMDWFGQVKEDGE